MVYRLHRTKLVTKFHTTQIHYDKKTLVKIPMLLCKNSYAGVGTGPYVGFLAEIRIGKIPSLTDSKSEKHFFIFSWEARRECRQIIFTFKYDRNYFWIEHDSRKLNK